jgi:hypothetical protein
MAPDSPWQALGVRQKYHHLVNPKISILTLLISTSMMAAEIDIIGQAVAHPRHESVKQPDGTFKESKYGDHKLAEAETFLSLSHPRPWTVAHAIEWFHKADDRSRIHIIRLLAASRDPRAALVLGAALESNVSLAAGEGLIDYFLPTAVCGGTEQQMEAAREWFASNKARLQSEALTK